MRENARIVAGLALIGAVTFALVSMAGIIPAPVVDDTEPSTLGIIDEPDPTSVVQPIDCAQPHADTDSILACEFLRQIELHTYRGPMMTVARIVQLGGYEAGWVLDAPTPAPFLPMDSCDPEQPQKCGEAVKAACKAIGKPNGVTTYKLAWLIGANGQKWNSCSGTCADGSYVYVACVQPKVN